MIDSSLDDVIKQEIYDNYDLVVRYHSETYSSSREYPITNMYGALKFYTTVLHRYKTRGIHFRVELLFREFGVFEKELMSYVC